MTDRRRLVGTFVLPTLLALAGTGCPAVGPGPVEPSGGEAVGGGEDPGGDETAGGSGTTGTAAGDAEACAPENPEACLQLAVRLAAEGREEESGDAAWVACNAGDVRGCCRLEHEAFDPNLGAPPRALRTCRAACDRGCPAGCIALADFLSYEGEQQEALATLAPFCTPTDHRTCDPLAELDVYDEPAGAQRLERLRAACAAGASPPACHAYGRRLIYDDHEQEALAPLSGACDAGVAPACAFLAAELRSLDRLAEAETAARRACDAGEARGCEMLGRDLDDSGDPETVRAELRGRCEAGETASCRGLAELLWSADETVEAAAYNRLACERGDRKSCANVGRIAYNLEGDARRAEATLLFRTYCETGTRRLCDARLRKAIEETEIAEDIAAAARDACNRDVAQGCRHAGWFLLEYEGDAAAAEPLLRRACDAGLVPACFDLAVALEDLDRLPEAETVRQGACTADPDACADAGYGPGDGGEGDYGGEDYGGGDYGGGDYDSGEYGAD